MFVSAIKKAHNVVEGFAVEAAFGLAAVLLACAAFLFAAVGVVLWLSLAIPPYLALLLIAFITALISATVYYLGRREVALSEKEASENAAASPLEATVKSLSSLAAPMDVVASGLFARQFKRAPVSTLAATAALGALLGMFANPPGDDD